MTEKGQGQPSQSRDLTRLGHDITMTFTADEDEMLVAVARWRGRHKRAPTLIEWFRLMQSMGWKKTMLPDSFDVEAVAVDHLNIKVRRLNKGG